MRALAWIPVLGAACAPMPGASADAGAPAVHYPELPSGGGPTLASATLVPVTFTGDARATELGGFVSWLASSGWLTEAGAEYGVQHVSFGMAVTLGDTLPMTLEADAARALIASRISDGTLPKGMGVVYVVFLPDGVVLLDARGNACRTNPGAGLHDSTNDPSAKAPYVLVPSCPARFSAMLSRVQSIELDAARLTVDTLTDPDPRDAPAYALTDTSSPWTALGAEAGDFCWGRLFTRDDHQLQRAWSNAKARAGVEPCVPASAAPAFGVDVSPASLQTLHVGDTQMFTLAGWAGGAVDDWGLRVTPWVGDFTITAQLDRATLNAGQTATLSVSVPFAVPDGTYGAVLVQATGQEERPQWPVSFVVH